MELAERVGHRLRALREARRLSLSALARRSGIGKATLSRLESGQRNPTLATLYALTTALDAPLSAVLPGPDGDAPPVSGAAVDARLIERRADRSLVTEAYRVDIRAGADQRSAAHAPGTYEQLIVLSGTVLVGPVDAPVPVPAGGHLRFAADVPHRYRSAGGTAHGILAVHYPVPGGGTGARDAAGAPAGDKVAANGGQRRRGRPD
ncbi:hypothetical protein Athai_30030 [Actinocatenispora thailandica]|uniref:HTH cro/C1-type domain-containing protein n=1 Tax=Actinocatenispora thailandica TaxID=227318 RepID=A0A7R7DPF3_9ACTN|nr:XRE family transcriptional regulator [Actinocatenispora thailandica]BCJ35500.1 hypothetical protein Athai_30030 [Actinocatenispora thailandica]